VPVPLRHNAEKPHKSTFPFLALDPEAARLLGCGNAR
jgi:hypothetical protein